MPRVGFNRADGEEQRHLRVRIRSLRRVGAILALLVFLQSLATLHASCPSSAAFGSGFGPAGAVAKCLERIGGSPPADTGGGACDHDSMCCASFDAFAAPGRAKPTVRTDGAPPRTLEAIFPTLRRPAALTGWATTWSSRAPPLPA